jgi:nicotinamide-nucleotide amidase
VDNDGRTVALAERVADAAKARGAQVAVAESLTGGQLSAALAAAPDASGWYAGGVTAYQSSVKYDLLDVPLGPVVSEPAALAMAEGVARITRATHAVAVTGVGGPDPQDGQEPGTVWLGVHAAGTTTARRLMIPGEPVEVCRGTVEAALEALLAVLTEEPEPAGT